MMTRPWPLFFAKMLVRLLAALLLLTAFMPSLAGASEIRHLLVLHSYHKGLTWTDNEDSGIRSVFQKHSADVELHTEYLDFKTIADEEHRQRLFRLLRHKYATLRFRAVIATDDDAYNFYLQHRETLFPGAPLFFCGVNYYSDEQRKGVEELITGVTEAFDLSATVELIRKLHPDAARLVVINDKTTTGLANRRIMEDVLGRQSGKLQVEYLEELSMEQLRSQISKLGRGDIILLMTFNHDSYGNVFNYDQSIALIAQAAAVPIYGVWDFYLGRGIVGGMLTSGMDQGRMAAEMALAYLDGTAIRNMPVVKNSPNRYMFDYQQLERFGLDETSLPAGSLVINRPETFYSENKQLVWIVATIFTSLVIIIRLLVTNLQQRKRNELALRESEERFRALVEQSPIGIVIIRDLRILYSNSRHAEVHGYSSPAETVGLDVRELIAPECLALFDEVVARHQQTPLNDLVFEGFGLCRDGSRFYGMVSATRILLDDGPASIAFVMDISERKAHELEIERLSAELVRNEKLAMLGQLSGSVSHELRNPLGVINNAVYLLKITLKDADAATKEYLEIIKQEIDNSLRIVTDLLDFTRRKAPRFKLISADELIRSSRLKCAIPNKVQFNVLIDDNLPLLHVDPQQMEQVLQNLIINAMQAMPDGGELTVSAKLVHGSGSQVQGSDIEPRTTNLEPHGYFIEISVSDTGSGISPEHMLKLFQPLFTTKSRGIGLGLVVCKNLVETNRGELDVTSQAGMGTTFFVRLPVRQPEAGND